MRMVIRGITYRANHLEAAEQDYRLAKVDVAAAKNAPISPWAEERFRAAIERLENAREWYLRRMVAS